MEEVGTYLVTFWRWCMHCGDLRCFKRWLLFFATFICSVFLWSLPWFVGRTISCELRKKKKQQHRLLPLSNSKFNLNLLFLTTYVFPSCGAPHVYDHILSGCLKPSSHQCLHFSTISVHRNPKNYGTSCMEKIYIHHGESIGKYEACCSRLAGCRY